MTLKVFLFLLALIIALIPTWAKPEKKWVKVALSLLAVLTFSGSWAAANREDLESAAKQDAQRAEITDLKKELSKQTGLLGEVRMGQGDEKAAARLVEVQKALVRSIADSKNQDFLGNVNRLLETAVPAQKQIAIENAKAELSIKAKWAPVHEFIMRIFDGKVSQLEEAGYIESNSQLPGEAVSPYRVSVGNYRFVKFVGGKKINFFLNPMTVTGNKIDGEYFLYIYQLEAQENANHQIKMSITISDSGLQMNDSRGDFGRTVISPLEDQEFMERINQEFGAFLTAFAVDVQARGIPLNKK